MNKLRKKTFITIFSILSTFVIFIMIFYNIQGYNREYRNIKDNLSRINNFIGPLHRKEDFNHRDNIDNRIIMDYDVYTIMFDNNKKITNIISHSDDYDTENISLVATNFLNKDYSSGLIINNLYFTNYVYNLNTNSLIIIDISDTKEYLLSNLLISLIIILITLIINYFLTKIITNFLVKPAEDSFIKQKEFVADASHELKTPLAVIMASAEALESNPKEKKWLNNIKDESDRMNNLITSLLDLSKLESGKNIETYQLENISKIIMKQVLTFESMAYEYKNMLETNIKDNIMFKCSSQEIKQLIMILLDNAIKHSYEEKTITINLEENHNEIILEIINIGDNIPIEEEEKIFERFYRLDKSRNRSSNRYGLGLAIAKNIVLNHNGKICAHSINNETTFKVVFKKKNIK